MPQAKINKSRADRIAALLARNYEGATDWQATVTDTLSDLRHLCDRHGLAFHECDRLAYGHYSAELQPDDIELDSRRRFAKNGTL